MNLFGTDKSELRRAFPKVCVGTREPTPMQDEVYSVLVQFQRRTLWIGLTLTVLILLGLLAFTPHALAMASALGTRPDDVSQSEQDRRLDEMQRNLARIEQRQYEDEQQLNRILGFGGGLACLTIMLQLIALLNQRNASNRVLQVVREREKGTVEERV